MSKIFYSLYDRLRQRRALAQAFAKVRCAKGAKTPGVDGQKAADFADHQEDELDRLVHELRTKSVLSASMQNVRVDRNRRARTAMARV